MRPSYYMDGVKVKKEVVQELLDDQKVTKDDTRVRKTQTPKKYMIESLLPISQTT